MQDSISQKIKNFHNLKFIRPRAHLSNLLSFKEFMLNV